LVLICHSKVGTVVKKSASSFHYCRHSSSGTRTHSHKILHVTHVYQIKRVVELSNQVQKAVTFYVNFFYIRSWKALQQRLWAVVAEAPNKRGYFAHAWHNRVLASGSTGDLASKSTMHNMRVQRMLYSKEIEE
jgi:hypothetical protein